jgi:ParB family chromosome partitioning protein
MAKGPALGKGLGALIAPKARVLSKSKDEPVDSSSVVRSVPIEAVFPSPLQPRTEFPEDHLAELVDSIRELGIIQPLIVRKSGDRYELIAGERRWRAAKQVGLTHVPAIEREASDREVLEMALIENLQRENLNPMEEAAAYLKLTREFGLTQEVVAKRVGKSRAAVANALRLLDLHPDVQGYLRTFRLSVGHAKVLLGLKSQDEQKALAEAVLRQGASVRATEKMVAQHLDNTSTSSVVNRNGKGGKKSATTKSPAIQRIENQLQHQFSTRVVITHGEKHGSIHFEYYGQDDLGRLLDQWGIHID